MANRNPTASSLATFKDMVVKLQNRVEGLVAAEELAVQRIASLETELKQTRDVVEELQIYASALEVELDAQHDNSLNLWVAAQQRRADSASDSSSASEPSLFDKLEEVERQVKAAMHDRDLKRAVNLGFCRKLDILQLRAELLPSYTPPAPEGEGTQANQQDLPIRFQWTESEHNAVNANAINEVTTYILAYGSTLHARAARPLFKVKREGVKMLVIQKFKRLSKKFNDYQLLQEHERQTDLQLQRANARINGDGDDAAVEPDDMVVELDLTRVQKLKQDRVDDDARSKSQTAKKYAAKYRAILRQLLPDGDDAKKPENDLVFHYFNQSPWVSDNDEHAAAGAKKVISRKWESDAFQKMKRLELRTDLKEAEPEDAKKLRKMKLPRRLPFPNDQASGSDDLPPTRKIAERVRPWMVDQEFLKRHPNAKARINRSRET